MANSSRSGRLVLFLILILAAGAATWYFVRDREEMKVEYSTVPVTRADLTQVVTATGTLEPVTTVDVGSQISGIIDKVLVDYNSIVKAGDVVAHIDAATYESRLRSAEADLSNAKANQRLAQLNCDRLTQLQQNDLVPQSDLDQALAQLAQADAQVQTRTASVESAKIDLSRCTIYSPIDGIVLSRQVDVGKTVAASFNTPVLFQIANDLTKMQIVGAIAEADIGNVEVGQLVNFTVDAFPNRQFRGRVSLIRNSPITVQNVVTYETIIEVRNDDQKLRPGMTANISVVIAAHPNVLRVPNNALRVRLPDVPAPATKSAGGEAAAATSGLKPMPDDLRRSYMTKAGFTPGSGRPTPEVIERARELAKVDGYEWPAFSGRRERETASNAPTVRTLYRLVGQGPNARPEAVNVKLGISDGSQTEVLEGLNEGDLVITGSSAPSAAAPSQSNNPFGPRRRF
ncbi:MAG TPA: efflux RND transporter periplasmic adaptor subunit [Opitutus sp.]|nr:efflux RND transporter periplasmic adaptor subunit [Opitutus sp.]